MLVERWSGPTCCARYIRRTILSENQYEAKFVTAAKTKADAQAPGAAERFADEEQQGAQRAEQQVPF